MPLGLRRQNINMPANSCVKNTLMSCIFGLCLLPLMAVAEHTPLAGLRDTATVLTPPTAVPTVVASNEIDMFFMQGFLHAKDRFFQMDSFRRTGSGTMAELVGSAALPNDIQLRTFGLRRAAWETYAASSPSARARVQAYANGVNAWLAEGNLPPEYGALELTQVERWDPVDTFVVAKLIAFSFDMDLGDIDRTISVLTYQGTGDFVGFDGTALFFEDTHRVQPPDDRVTVPGFLSSIGGFGKSELLQADDTQAAFNPMHVSDSHLNLARNFYDNISGDSLTRELFNIDGKDKGSNWWLISGDLTDTGASLIANDPHSSLSTPSLFYPMHLSVQDESGTPVSFAGTSIAGTPALVHGCNNWLCWGSTVNPIDAIDIFTEELRFNSLGLPTHTVYQGQEERIIWVYQSYYINQFDGVPDNLIKHNASILGEAITFVVPRRNNGPIIGLDTTAGTGLSLQYTGFGPTFELEAVIGYSQSETVEEFGSFVELWDIASQNFGVVDIHGNIGYFALAEVPIREDFQTLMTADGGIPPIFIRDGTGTLMHEWMPTDNPLPNQALPTAIIPPAEMPRLVNPAKGFITNANNDPVGVTLDNNSFNQVRPGGGLYYLNAGYVAYRMGRIDRLMEDAIAAGPVSIEQFKSFQANNQMLDAELVMPHVLDAWINAQAEGAWPGLAQFLLDPQLQQVFALYADWDFSTPTGIAEGYDPGENPLALSPPTQAEIDASVAATVWGLWRGRILANTIDGTLEALQLGGSLLPPHRQAYNSLKYLLDTFDSGQGIGASGIPFFNVPGAPNAAAARDFLLLFSIREALDLLASDEFASAYANSTDLMDYRWGKLHRVVFAHTLGDVFSLPNGLYGLSTVEGLAGVARSGGYDVLDASSHSARSGGLNEFMFGSGPFRRFVAQVFPAPIGVVPEQIVPGGQSGILGSPLYANQLYLWLVNAHLPLFLDPDVVAGIAVESQVFGPPGS
jgi:penicillin amidase